ncbi:uncharacterized protein LOC129222828 [Uloborus diversus]|uniref:uncharacterized protein LOC129222828 n=1 Tax=Uloborus diversus TaxID=327109 RepID=UPI0024093178|nr:uncharacterized protein LOC129222828 [Uloborus diversus]
MADVGEYCGTWRIVKCIALSWEVESTGIEGTEFTLEESGDVTWNISENTEPMPFFKCETFEMYLSDPHYIRFFGTFVEHVIEFRVDQPKEDTIRLTYEGWCILQCERVSSANAKHYLPFSFLCALEEGYFSDLRIIANNGKEFKVHKIVLKLGNPEINWDASPGPLDNLSEDVLFTILHYLYSECLPCDLKEETARNCVAFTPCLPGFESFRNLCQLFLKNSALKQQIISLVTDMHSCANLIIDYFSGKMSGQESPSNVEPNGPLTNGTTEPDNLMDPAKLCYVIRQALRESAIAGVKMLILCDLFSKRKNELSRDERHEIIKYCKSRLPIFMNQLYRLLDVIKISFSNLSAIERMEIASYFVPEIEDTLDSMFKFVTETKSALEQIISISSSNNSDKNFSSFADRWKKGSVGEALGKSLKNALHMRELMKLRSFHERVTVSFLTLMHKKESFSEMNLVNKNRSVAKNLEQLIDEIPMFMLRIEELKSALDEKLTWKEWKYLFKLGTSKGLIMGLFNPLPAEESMQNSISIAIT